MSHPTSGVGHNRPPPDTGVTASQFAAHFAEAARHLPRSAREAIRQAACARLAARWQAGRADAALYFDDLVEAVEAALVGRSHVILRGTKS